MAEKGMKPDRSFSHAKEVLFCPSAQPGLNQSLILGIVDKRGDESQVTLLSRPVKVSVGTMSAFFGSTTRPTEVFRFAAPCEKGGCRNWSGSHCRVAEQLVQILPAISAGLPECSLRPMCRWFQQEGRSACERCPQVLTDDQGFEAALNGSGPVNSPYHTDRVFGEPPILAEFQRPLPAR